MKYNLSIFFALFLIMGCGSDPNQSDVAGSDLESKRAALRTLRSELQSITQQITELENEINALDPNAQKNTATLVSSMAISKTHFKRYVEVQGAVEAEDMVDVTSEIPGRVIQMSLKEGDNVRKGQLIAKLDTEQLDKQIAELDKSLELASTLFERQDRLWKQNIGSEIQFLEAKNNKERLEKSMETIKVQLTKANVYAPAGGVVERVIVQSGEVAGAGVPILQILNTNKLKVTSDVPEDLLRAVKVGDQVKVHFPALDSEQNARITLIGRTIDPANRTFKVEAGLRKSNRYLKPNLLAVMYIQDFDQPNVITVPIENVLQEVGGKDFVFIAEDGNDGTFAKKIYIETGESYQGKIIVQSGLNGNEVLITEGARTLSANERIKIIES